jgi:molybdenum cofactor synthesis domain-containing protein
VKTAVLVIIGDEILTGKVKDENSYVFTKAMFDRGVKVCRIETIPDDIDIIAHEVMKYSSRCDYVCTSGGVGPTHDDRTLAAIAKATERPLKENEEAVAFFKKAQSRAGRGEELSASQLRMLAFPYPAKLYFVEPMWVPLLRVENIFVFPGVPALFENFMRSLAHLFQGDKFYRKIVFTDRFEFSIADVLAKIQNQYDMLSIGSYPQVPRDRYSVMVTVEGAKKEYVDEATDLLLPLIDGRLHE